MFNNVIDNNTNILKMEIFLFHIFSKIKKRNK